MIRLLRKVDFGQGHVRLYSGHVPTLLIPSQGITLQRKKSELARDFPRNPAISRLSVNYIITQTPIRQDSHKTVEARFSRFSGLQSRSISALSSRFYCPVGRGSQEAGVPFFSDG
jgi:hypothetical protein